jgi:hypothetical protein
MQCPVCAALKRELSQEGEIEAVATLNLSARFAGPGLMILLRCQFALLHYFGS